MCPWPWDVDSTIRPRMRLRRPFPLLKRHATPHSDTPIASMYSVYDSTREAGARERAPSIGAVDSLPSREDQAPTLHNERLVHSHEACERVRTAVCRQLTNACHRRGLTSENNRGAREKEEEKTSKQRKRHSTQPLENTQAAPYAPRRRQRGQICTPDPCARLGPMPRSTTRSRRARDKKCSKNPQKAKGYFHHNRTHVPLAKCSCAHRRRRLSGRLDAPDPCARRGQVPRPATEAQSDRGKK